MKNPSGHQGENERVKEVNNNRYDISSIKRVTRKFLEVSRYVCAKQRQRNVQNKCAARAKLFFFFAKSTYCCFFTFSLPSPFSKTWFYILFEQTVNFIESFAISPWLNLYIRDTLATQLTDTLTGYCRFFPVQYQELYHLSLHWKRHRLTNPVQKQLSVIPHHQSIVN